MNLSLDEVYDLLDLGLIALIAVEGAWLLLKVGFSVYYWLRDTVK